MWSKMEIIRTFFPRRSLVSADVFDCMRNGVHYYVNITGSGLSLISPRNSASMLENKFRRST